MGMFSPTVLPGPSWTQGLAQATGTITDALMQRRQFDLAKRREAFDEQMRTQDQARQNAMAGYDPSHIDTPAEATPASLAAISNAGVADASHPVYDPTKSLTYALMNGRNAAMMDRTEAQIQGRADQQVLRNQGNIAGIQARYGTIDPSGTYAPGSMTYSQLSARQPTIDFNESKLRQQGTQFGSKLAETHRHNVAMENKQMGGNRMSFGGSGGGSNINKPEATYIRNRTSALEKPQSVAILKPDGSPTLLRKYTPGLSEPDAHQQAKHEVNMTRLDMGATASDTIPDAPAVQPGKTLAPKDSATASGLTLQQGKAQPLHQNSDKTNQGLRTVSDRIPTGPTAANIPEYTSLGNDFKAATDAINASSLPAAEKMKRLGVARARYNDAVSKVGRPK